MKRNRLYILSLALATGIGLTSCNDFLDELPDNRMEIKNAEELNYILVNAYPSVHPAAVFEWYSDNSTECYNTSWTSERFQEQAYRWQDITESSDPETPKMVWDAYYSSIENANQVIKFVEESEDPSQFNAQYGEALIVRAYAMFTLSTMFCQAYDPATADTENSGMPYLTKPQEFVGEVYQRGTLAELYAKVESDIQRGLPLIENNYAKPKYHFTKAAANAFAARFYLYYHKYDEAIRCADVVLGNNPASMLRDWASWNALSANKMVQPNAYISANEEANL
ncbi:MAG: RagB/SusD family nutrient uptake outer membrane protein, partial [Prevotella sp.]|nr:RagB/SusD family nutrient uptake outer membrane protein [Prevotella sp.]